VPEPPPQPLRRKTAVGKRAINLIVRMSSFSCVPRAVASHGLWQRPSGRVQLKRNGTDDPAALPVFRSFVGGYEKKTERSSDDLRSQLLQPLAPCPSLHGNYSRWRYSRQATLVTWGSTHAGQENGCSVLRTSGLLTNRALGMSPVQVFRCQEESGASLGAKILFRRTYCQPPPSATYRVMKFVISCRRICTSRSCASSNWRSESRYSR